VQRYKEFLKYKTSEIQNIYKILGYFQIESA